MIMASCSRRHLIWDLMILVHEYHGGEQGNRKPGKVPEQ